MEKLTAPSPDLPTPSELRELRKRANLSQSDVAKLLGLTQVCISHYELGKRTPPASLLSTLRLYVSSLCSHRIRHYSDLQEALTL